MAAIFIGVAAIDGRPARFIAQTLAPQKSVFPDALTFCALRSYS